MNSSKAIQYISKNKEASSFTKKLLVVAFMFCIVIAYYFATGSLVNFGTLGEDASGSVIVGTIDFICFVATIFEIVILFKYNDHLKKATLEKPKKKKK